jgi:hypothetical protein
MKNILDKLKYVAAGAIVLTALALMAPQLFGFAFSLARLGTFIMVTVAISAAVAFGWQFVSRKKNKADSPSTDRGES